MRKDRFGCPWVCLAGISVRDVSINRLTFPASELYILPRRP